MSVKVCQSQSALFFVESEPEHTWLIPTNKKPEQPDQSALWSIIQSQPPSTIATAYVHPLIRRSSSFMSQSSLEMCTEGLGSETGIFGDTSDDGESCFNCSDDEEEVVVKHKGGKLNGYPSSASRKSATGTFPPPLSSISSRDGCGIQMRTRRHDGRLVMEAVPVASQNYLNSHRHDGRLLLSFADSATTESEPTEGLQQKEEKPLDEVPEDFTRPPPSNEIMSDQEDSKDEEDHKEEVEVFDRGNMVGVKISTQRQPPTLPDNKLLFTSKQRNRKEMLHHMSQCSELRRPLFVGESGCIATSS